MHSWHSFSGVMGWISFSLSHIPRQTVTAMAQSPEWDCKEIWAWHRSTFQLGRISWTLPMKGDRSQKPLCTHTHSSCFGWRWHYMPTSLASPPTLHVPLFLWVDSVADGSFHFAHKWIAGEIYGGAKLLMASFCTLAPSRASIVFKPFDSNE